MSFCHRRGRDDSAGERPSKGPWFDDLIHFDQHDHHVCGVSYGLVRLGLAVLLLSFLWLAAGAARRRRRTSLSSPASFWDACRTQSPPTSSLLLSSSRTLHSPLVFHFIWTVPSPVLPLLHRRPLPAIHEALTSSFYPLSSPSPVSLDEKISRNPSRASRTSTTPLLSLSALTYSCRPCPRSSTKACPSRRPALV